MAFLTGRNHLPGKFVATVLFLLVIPGGVIDFFPIHNAGWSEVTYQERPVNRLAKEEHDAARYFSNRPIC